MVAHPLPHTVETARDSRQTYEPSADMLAGIGGRLREMRSAVADYLFHLIEPEFMPSVADPRPFRPLWLRRPNADQAAAIAAFNERTAELYGVDKPVRSSFRKFMSRILGPDGGLGGMTMSSLAVVQAARADRLRREAPLPMAPVTDVPDGWWNYTQYNAPHRVTESEQDIELRRRKAELAADRAAQQRHQSALGHLEGMPQNDRAVLYNLAVQNIEAELADSNPNWLAEVSAETSEQTRIVLNMLVTREFAFYRQCCRQGIDLAGIIAGTIHEARETGIQPPEDMAIFSAVYLALADVSTGRQTARYELAYDEEATSDELDLPLLRAQNHFESMPERERKILYAFVRQNIETELTSTPEWLNAVPDDERQQAERVLGMIREYEPEFYQQCIDRNFGIAGIIADAIHRAREANLPALTDEDVFAVAFLALDDKTTAQEADADAAAAQLASAATPSAAHAQEPRHYDQSPLVDAGVYRTVQVAFTKGADALWQLFSQHNGAEYQFIMGSDELIDDACTALKKIAPGTYSRAIDELDARNMSLRRVVATALLEYRGESNLDTFATSLANSLGVTLTSMHREPTSGRSSGVVPSISA